MLLIMQLQKLATFGFMFHCFVLINKWSFGLETLQLLENLLIMVFHLMFLFMIFVFSFKALETFWIPSFALYMSDFKSLTRFCQLSPHTTFHSFFPHVHLVQTFGIILNYWNNMTGLLAFFSLLNTGTGLTTFFLTLTLRIMWTSYSSESPVTCSLSLDSLT